MAVSVGVHVAVGDVEVVAVEMASVGGDSVSPLHEARASIWIRNRRIHCRFMTMYAFHHASKVH